MRFFILLILFAHFTSCKNAVNDIEKVSDEKATFFDTSNYYMQFYKGGTDSFNRYSIKRELTILGEESFINSNGHQLYLIFFAPHSIMKMQDKYVYVIKVLDGIGIITQKKISDKIDVLSERSNNTILDASIDIKSVTRLYPADTLCSLRKTIDSTLNFLHEYDETIIEDAASTLFYFDGQKYYIINSAYTNAQIMSVINRLFISSQLFPRVDSM